MVYRNEVSFDGAFIQNINRQVADLPREFKAEFKRRTRNPLRNLRRRVRKTPSRFPAHPFIWSFDQAKQARARRWWFAAIAGKIPGVRIDTAGGRYRRTGRGPKSIKIFFDRPEGTITVEIPGSGFGLYTVGPRQVPSHARTGWPRVDKELEKAEVEFLDNAITVWTDITDRIIS
jgi:hypothetical protein